MKQPRRQIWPTGLLTFLGAVAVTAFVATPPLAACGPYSIGVYFWIPHQPGPARKGFLQGQLGILDSELDAAYHYVAYRHLAGLETEQTNAESLETLWSASRLGQPRDPLEAWRETRANIAGIEPIGWFSRSRTMTSEEGGNTSYSYFMNCLDDGLLTAAETLTARIEHFGAASREVRAWVTAQDQVFENCADGESIPVPLDDSWDPLIRADRAYQIAAAHFYATRFSEAADQFRAIARDADSPWREISAYLVARALIRDQQFTGANAQLRAVLEDPDFSTVHEPARRLLAYSALRSEPDTRRRELEERLLKAHLEPSLRQDFIDYRWLLEHNNAGHAFGSWMATMRQRTVGGDPPRSLALKRWRGETAAPWLVAALVTADPDNADPNSDVEPLLDAAAAVPSSSPAYLTAIYHRSRLLIGLGRTEEAKSILDPVLALPSGEISTADHNRLSLLRAEITPDLDDYLRRVTLVPAGLGWDDGSRDLIPTGGEQGPEFPYFRHGDTLLPDSAVELLNHGLTLEELLELAQGDSLPEPWRRRLTLTVWTRAVTTDHHDVALAAAPLVKTLAPELATAMAAYTSADPDQRRFEAAWTLLRFPGLSPVLRWNIGRKTTIDEADQLRDNGWCDAPLQADAIPGQIVRTPEQIATVQAGLARLQAWPNHLGQVVLAHTETHPDDPRLAEALHRVVRATRIGCPIGGYGNISRATFQLLHKRFPESSWAEQTPYWFD